VGHVWRAEGSLIKKVTENNREKDQEAKMRYNTVKKTLKKINPVLDKEMALDIERRKSVLEAAMVLNGPP